MKIIDGHSHMFSASIAKEMGAKAEGHMEERVKEMSKHSVKENIERWIHEMDKHGIEKTVFMATASLNKDFIEFINSSDRFIGMAKINPTLPDAVETLKKEIAAGMRGVKLYATEGAFDVGSEKAYPFYKFCEENNIPIVIHFGVTIGNKSDLQTGNPLKLSRVLKEFPNLNFVIAHFGAGFFREVLMLKYKQKNLFVDTSGTNNWLVHQDNSMTLKDVFRKTIEVFTPQGIIFGTDTIMYPDGYRTHILEQQMKILDELGLSEKDKEDIMCNNARRIFGI